jgi:dihydropteroate synthase
MQDMLNFSSRSHIMGIVNATPDSFSGDGVAGSIDAALRKIEEFLKQGVDIIDIGAESTRPGNKKISLEEEKKRLLPLIEAVTKAFPNAFISIDTMKAAVAEESLNRGVQMINDVTALEHDPLMAETIAKYQPYIVLMDNRSRNDAVLAHDKGAMYRAEDKNKDSVESIKNSFFTSISKAEKAGIARDKIILDPGIGFGKTVEQNMQIIARMDFAAMGFPLLLGASRKSFIGHFLGLEIDERTIPGLAVSAAARMGGCMIFRTHDAGETVKFFRMFDALLALNH